jgi:predicted CXXCH cytochrome family protein
MADNRAQHRPCATDAKPSTGDMMCLLYRLVVLSGLVVLGTTPGAAQTPGTVPGYVGSEICSGCHEGEVQAWTGSHHALAWTQPGEATVLGDFDDGVFEHKGVTTRFSRRDDAFFVETEGADGAMRAFEVTGVAGIAPLQQYLVAIEPGRLQALDIAWDVEGRRWYHLYPDQALPAGDGLHWTGPYKNWNARCAECHATGFVKNYDPRSRTYDSTQAEIGVGCEGCHGPGEAHVAWANVPGDYDATHWSSLTAKGFTLGFAAGSPEAEIQQCAGCHSRREPFGDGNPLPGTAFHDAYRLALLREGLYHADGTIKDEVYVYGSFLQSKMYANGVRCTDCHDAHTAGLKAEGNAVCAQCHSPAGNPRFATLRLADYDDSSHYFHPKESAGAQCVSCHMIERVYMGVDGRRDHSFRVPRPDLFLSTGTPNACTDCHTDRNAAWAATEIAQRFPDSDRRGPHFSQTFAAARHNPVASAESLLEIAEDDGLPGMIRSSALDLLRPAADEAIAARTAPLIGDDDPLVRAAAISVQRGAPPTDRIQRLVPALEDPARAVRIAAAREFLDAPVARLPTRIAEAARSATGEWRASFFAKTDFPETHMAIGGAALVLRNLGAAEQAFRETVHLDPQRVEAWAMITRILATTGDLDGARAVLDDALAVNPSSEVLQSLLGELSGEDLR